jgi:hypothetical protein
MILKTIKCHYMKYAKYYNECVSFFVSMLFIYTGINKLLDHPKFEFEISRSFFLSKYYFIISIPLPVAELIIAMLLLVKKTRLIGLYSSFTLMLLFTEYIWVMLRYSYDLTCSCGGIIGLMSWRQHLVFNSVITVMCLISIILHDRGNEIDKRIIAQ